jgi:hypothetical protein
MHRSSFWKTTLLAAGIVVLCATVFAVAGLFGPFRVPLQVLAAALGLAAALVTIGGIVCLWRDSRESAGKADLFASGANAPPSVGILSRLGLRALQGRSLRCGDFVRVRGLPEIVATLDANGAIDGLPFMPEMISLCGRVFQVHRRIDKINDMRHKTGLRRVRDTVSLAEVRCDGAAHDGCQAGCQILWKEAWLERVPSRAAAVAPAVASAIADPRLSDRVAPCARGDGSDGRRYVCQMTELWDASTPMSRYDYRQDLRPLFAGNLGIGVYLVAIFTRLFNMVQLRRGGVTYPAMPESPSAAVTPLVQLQLAPGDRVRVRSKPDVSRSLVNGRNRGLWFDRDMIRFCGQQGVVLSQVHRVIHEATGKMAVMKTPCVVIDGVVGTGEFLRLCAQHEYIFWREAWLERLSGAKPAELPSAVPVALISES